MHFLDYYCWIGAYVRAVVVLYDFFPTKLYVGYV
jgi:hypothetical protein